MNRVEKLEEWLLERDIPYLVIGEQFHIDLADMTPEYYKEFTKLLDETLD